MRLALATGDDENGGARLQALWLPDGAEGFDSSAQRCSKTGMTKAFTVLILAMMVIHLIKPLGWPGLRRRADFWKLAVLALAAISATAVLSHWA